MSDTVESIFISLLSDRGASNFDQTQKQIARRIAVMLADDSGDLSASALSALMALLPAKAGAGEAPYDLSKLTDEEFHQLDVLTAKMADASAPPALYVEPRWPKVSYRSLSITETVLLFDQCEAEIEQARRKGQRTDLPAEDLLLIRDALTWLVGSIATPEQVFSYIAENAQFEVRKEFRERTDAIPVEPAVAAAPDVAPVAGAAGADNVIKPPARVWGGEAMRGTVERGVW